MGLDQRDHDADRARMLADDEYEAALAAEEGLRRITLSLAGVECTTQEEAVDRIRHRVYRDTNCGAWFALVDGGFRFGSIVEGSDVEITGDTITWDQIAEIEDDDDLDTLLCECLVGIDKAVYEAVTTTYCPLCGHRFGVGYELTDVGWMDIPVCEKCDTCAPPLSAATPEILEAGNQNYLRTITDD